MTCDTISGDLFVVESIHNGSDWCVRRATLAEIEEQRLGGEGWAMCYEDAVALAKQSAKEYKCRWFDFSMDPSPGEEISR